MCELKTNLYGRRAFGIISRFGFAMSVVKKWLVNIMSPKITVIGEEQLF